MRILLSALLAASLLSSNMALAESCARPADRAAFDVVGLKSKLMVTALTCNTYEKYNSFVVRFRPALISANDALNSWFGRSYGKRAQAQYDDYITSLANVHSQAGIRQGTLFCNKNVGLFDEVMGLKNNIELTAFAGGKNIEQPLELADCTTSAPQARVRQANATPAPANKH